MTEKNSPVSYWTLCSTEFMEMPPSWPDGFRHVEEGAYVGGGMRWHRFEDDGAPEHLRGREVQPTVSRVEVVGDDGTVSFLAVITDRSLHFGPVAGPESLAAAGEVGAAAERDRLRGLGYNLPGCHSCGQVVPRKAGPGRPRLLCDDCLVQYRAATRVGQGAALRDVNAQRTATAAERTVAAVAEALPHARTPVQRQVGELRIAHPDASLAQLAEIMGVTKHVYAGHLRRLVIAGQVARLAGPAS